MFGKTIWFPNCQVTSSRSEDLVLLDFYLQMLNDKNVKTHETVEDANINSSRWLGEEEKNAVINENCILRKWV